MIVPKAKAYTALAENNLTGAADMLRSAVDSAAATPPAVVVVQRLHSMFYHAVLIIGY